MNLLVAWGIGLTALWMTMLTVVVILLIRQVAIHQVQLASQTNVTLSFDGPAIGSEVPRQFLDTMPDAKKGRLCVLSISATCVPCRDLVSELRGRKIEAPVVALVTGREELASDLSKLLPRGVHTILDPEAGGLARSLNINTTPFAVEISEGVVTRKKYLKSAADLMAFVHGDVGQVSA